MKFCVVLSTQRSGSTFLVDFLSSSPGILIHSELFQRLRPELLGSPKRPRHYDIAYQTFRKSTFVRKFAHRFRRSSLITEYLDGVFSPRAGVDVIGMKLMYDQARRYPEVLSWLGAHDVFYVHLVRENLLEMIVSRELAVKRGTYSMLQPLDAIKVHLEIDKLTADLTRIVGEIEHFRRFCAGLPSHEVTYESLVADKAGEVRKILDLLGAGSHEPVGSILRKTNVATLQDVIDNYDEVAPALKKHPQFSRFVT
jgi:LPS sulfotransferase NodH